MVVAGQEKRNVKFAVIKRSISIDGLRISVSLEDEFWYGLLEIAEYKNECLSAERATGP